LLELCVFLLAMPLGPCSVALWVWLEPLLVLMIMMVLMLLVLMMVLVLLMVLVLFVL
jgi:hypothetical protein